MQRLLLVPLEVRSTGLRHAPLPLPPLLACMVKLQVPVMERGAWVCDLWLLRATLACITARLGTGPVILPRAWVVLWTLPCLATSRLILLKMAGPVSWDLVGAIVGLLVLG